MLTSNTSMDKQDITYQHFSRQLGSCAPRSLRLNLEKLGWTPQDLCHLDVPFTEQEVHSTIRNMPKEKAPGPDGYIGTFLCKCWNIIKKDWMEAM